MSRDRRRAPQFDREHEQPLLFSVPESPLSRENISNSGEIDTDDRLGEMIRNNKQKSRNNTTKSIKVSTVDNDRDSQQPFGYVEAGADSTSQFTQSRYQTQTSTVKKK